jgi:hypothetical protein
VRFQLDQRFAGSPDEVMAAYTDPALYDRMVGLSRVDPPTVLDVVPEGDIVVMRVRFRFIADLPGPAKAIIEPTKLTWIDETRYDLVAHTASTRLLPDHYPDRLRAAATSRFEPDQPRPAAPCAASRASSPSGRRWWPDGLSAPSSTGCASTWPTRPPWSPPTSARPDPRTGGASASGRRGRR